MSEDDLTPFDAVSDWVAIATDEIIRCWERVPGAEIDRLVEMLAGCDGVLLAGSGRCALLLPASAGRLSAAGLQAEVWAGGALPRHWARGRCALLACPSGGTEALLTLARGVRRAGGRVAACVGRAGSPLAAAADVPLVIDAFAPGNGRPPASQQQPGALFDQMVFILIDAVAETLARQRGVLP